MRIISIEEVITYTECPVKYKLKYKTDKKSDLISLMDKYDMTVKKIFYTLMLRVQAGHSTNMVHVKRSWGTAWQAEMEGFEVVTADPKSLKGGFNAKMKSGITALMKMYEEFCVKPNFVIAVDAKYSVKLTQDITLTGKWDLVREVDGSGGTKLVEIVSVKTDEQYRTEIYNSKDLKLTADSYAFRKTTGQAEDNALYYRTTRGVLYLSNRSTDDYKLLINTVKNVVKAIDTGIIFPSVSNNCSTCAYRHLCAEELSGSFVKDLKMEGGEAI